MVAQENDDITTLRARCLMRAKLLPPYTTSSWSATVSVETHKTKHSCNPSTESFSSSRQVHFPDEEVTQEISRNPLHEQVPDFVLWYQEDEYRLFKATFVAQAKKMARGELQGSSMIVGIFKACQEEGMLQMQREDKDLPPVAPVRSEQLRQHQNEGLSESEEEEVEMDDECFVGLERMAARRIARDKPVRRDKLTDLVREIQHHEEDCLFEANSEDENADLQREVLRMACEKISKPSRLFAHRLAVVVQEQQCRQRRLQQRLASTLTKAVWKSEPSLHQTAIFWQFSFSKQYGLETNSFSSRDE